jgi:NitT/TauT family transport system ATP-binding protein
MELVSFRNVEKAYRPRQGKPYVAVRNFNLETQPFEFFCLLGPSGCGKTTVLNMLAGFEQPTAGDIAIAGRPVRAPGRDRAVVFQGDDSLFAWLTALENVEFGLRMRGVARRERRERARHFLDLVGLAGQEHKHPPQLSGGMKQRIQIARVLANEPTMLLMDEPFAALDAQTRQLMQEQMREIALAARTSVFFITHDIDEAIILGSRIGVMMAGPASTLKGVITVSLGEARNRTDDGFIQVYREVHQMIREEVLKSASEASRNRAAAR